MITETGEEGPIYGVKLFDSLPLGKGGFSQALPSRSDLVECRRKMKLDRVVAGFEVLTEHFRHARNAAIELIQTLRELADHQNGCPLPKYEKEWNAAMTRADELFAKYDDYFGRAPSAQPAPAESSQTELQALPAAEPPQTLQNLNERGPSAQPPQAEPSKNQTPESEPAGIGAVHPAGSSQEHQAAEGQHSASETRCSGFRITDETQGKPESG